MVLGNGIEVNYQISGNGLTTTLVEMGFNRSLQHNYSLGNGIEVKPATVVLVNGIEVKPATVVLGNGIEVKPATVVLGYGIQVNYQISGNGL